MSEVRNEVRDLRGSLTHCCPVCLQPWRPLEELRVVHNKVYYGAQLLDCGPVQARLLVCLLEKPGTVVRNAAIHHFIYGLRSDGGPYSGIQAVFVSKMNKQFKKHKVPFRIKSVSREGYVLIATEVAPRGD